jgi:hypothetical protein
MAILLDLKSELAKFSEPLVAREEVKGNIPAATSHRQSIIGHAIKRYATPDLVDSACFSLDATPSK